MTQHDLSDGRRICVWCLGPTARVGRDGYPRHGWCEPYGRRDPIWTRSHQNPRVPGVPDQGSQAPERTFAKPPKKKPKAK